jgi:hypothetical protein
MKAEGVRKKQRGHKMRKLLPWAIVLCVGLSVWFAVVAVPGQEQHHKEADVSWDSPRMRKVIAQGEREERNRSSVEKISPGQRYSAGSEFFFAALKKEFSKEELHRLAASCATMPVYVRKQTQFQYDLLVHLVAMFADSGDREGLVILLSSQCPPRDIYDHNIEEFVASVGEDVRNCGVVVEAKTMTDPILIFGGAYERCKVPEVRGAIAAAVRRAFTGLGVTGENDADFVRNAMKFYEQNKDQLVLNQWYPSFYSRYEWSAVHGKTYIVEEECIKQPLFKWKAPQGSDAPQANNKHSAKKP